MKVDLSFTYSVNEIPPRCRKPRWVDKNGKTTVVVRELNAGDMKIAFIVKDYNSETVIRAYDGMLYKVAIRHTSEGKEWMTIENLKVRLECQARTSWGCKSYDEVIDELQEVANRYVIVGNTVYETVGEPRYCIYTFGLGHNHGGTSLSVDYHFNENISSERYFDALHYDDAVRMASDIAMSRGDTDSLSSFRNADYIDVVDEQYVTCNPSAHKNNNPVLMNMEKIIENCSSIEEAAFAVMSEAVK